MLEALRYQISDPQSIFAVVPGAPIFGYRDRRFQDQQTGALELSGCDVSEFPFDTDPELSDAPVDEQDELSFAVTGTRDALQGEVLYSPLLIAPTRVEGLVQDFGLLLERAPRDLARPVSALLGRPRA